ncbi:YHS domain-containing protein [Desulfosarcina sp. OttesenSCG-928-B08]|nr:YHS domain-containing protein [Desulfosarcina sp. OttesenSCG-928-B08]
MGVLRLLLLLPLLYIAYRAVKFLIQAGNKNTEVATRAPESPLQPSDPMTIDDVMLQDMVCGVHFPKREGVALEHGGQTYVFCSATCRDRFLEEQKNRH